MEKRRLFRGATLIDGTGSPPLEDSFLLVEGGRIKATGKEGKDDLPDFDEEVNLSGKFIIPGLMNCHTHVVMDPVPDMQAFAREQTPVTFAVRGVRNLQTLLRSGTTFIRDMGAPHAVDLGLKKCLKEGLFQGPEMYCSARMITMTGGHGWMFGREADGPDDVRKAAREQLKAGTDVVKIMATGGVLTPGVEPGSPQLSEEEIRAAVEEAHKAGKKIATHAQGTTGIKNAVRAGVDSVEHGCFLDDEVIEMMAE
nr:amidohydrolase family protein [Synergistales bacterium]